MSRFHMTRSGAWKIAIGALGFGVLSQAFLRGAFAQTPPPDQCSASGKACGFAISDSQIQKMTPLFKLQAQISQAKMPVGDAVFSTLIVNVLSGSTQKCQETFSNVNVRSGVLNLEIGRTINCAFDDVLAKYNDLSFQICIGDTGAGNCLKPIQMSSVPYAIKANYASQSQSAYRAELASRANYAQRLSADSNMLNQNQLGQGYFDVQTPGVAGSGTGDVSALTAKITALDPMAFVAATGGFFYWSPTDVSNANNTTVNVALKNPTTSNLDSLGAFNIFATETGVVGRLRVLDTAYFRHGLTAYYIPAGGVPTQAFAVSATSGNFVVSKTANFGGTVNITSGPLNVNGFAQFNGALVTFAAGSVVDMGAATLSLPTAPITTPLTMSGNGKATFNGGVDIGSGTLAVKSGATIDMSAATVIMPSTVATPTTTTGKATFTGGVDVTAGTLAVKSGATIDMSAATVVMPSTYSLPNLIMPEGTVTGGPGTACKSTTVSNVKFCALGGITVNNATGASCDLRPVATDTYGITACGAITCKAECFAKSPF